MVVPSERSCYLFGFRYSYLIRYAVTFDYADGVFEEFVSVLYGHILDVKSIWFQGSRWFHSSKVVLAYMILIDIYTIVLHVAEIDSINGYIANCLCYHLGAATGAAHKESYTKDEGEQEQLNEAVKLTQSRVRILTE